MGALGDPIQPAPLEEGLTCSCRVEWHARPWTRVDALGRGRRAVRARRSGRRPPESPPGVPHAPAWVPLTNTEETTMATKSPVTNGVNVQALLDARNALAEAPEGAKFQWRAFA